MTTATALDQQNGGPNRDPLEARRGAGSPPPPTRIRPPSASELAFLAGDTDPAPTDPAEASILAGPKAWPVDPAPAATLGEDATTNTPAPVADFPTVGGRARLFSGRCESILPALPPAHFHALITDPPYGIGFLARKWDRTIPGPAVWETIRRSLRPGALGFVFGFPRTFHRLGVTLEEAGFVIRDLLFWLRADNMPKGEDLGKRLDRRNDRRAETLRFTRFFRSELDRLEISNRQIDDLFGLDGMAGHWTTAAKQPRVPTVTQWQTIRAAFPDISAELDDYVAEFNTLKGTPSTVWELRPKYDGPVKTWQVWQLHEQKPKFTGTLARGGDAVTPAGRLWQGYNTTLRPAYEPIFLIQNPSPDPATHNALNFETGALHTQHPDNLTPGGNWPPNLALDPAVGDILDLEAGGPVSRFFYCPKSSPAERYHGAGDLPHPSPKPLRLMTWLCQLLRPAPGGQILDPFMGSGTTGAAAALAGLDFTGIDELPDHVSQAEARIRTAPELWNVANCTPRAETPALFPDLFGGPTP